MFNLKMKHSIFIAILMLIIFIIPGFIYPMEPYAVIDGLGVYKIGEGEPVFLMPYPHASTAASIAESPLVDILNSMNRSVITFDPPGAYRSTRTPIVDMDEMLACTNETLDYFGIDSGIDLIGHSMSSFCALAFSIEHRSRVRRLVLVGSTTGWPAVSRWGVHKHWKWTQKKRWQIMYLGTRLFLGFGNLKTHKKLDNLIDYASYVDKKHVTEIEIETSDHKRPLPVRSKWKNYLRNEKADYKDRLNLLEIPVLICVGRYDPQTPVVMSRELRDGIKDSELIVFDNSGHSPHIEEQDYFSRVVREFLE